MSNPTLFLYTGNGTLAAQDRSGSLTLTGSGAVRYAPASGARINYCCNPRLASNTSYWGGNGASGTITRVSDGAFSGGNALEVSATTGGHGSNNSNTGIKVPNPSQSFTISFDAYLVSGASDWNIVVSLRDAANGFLSESSSSSVTVTSSVQRFSHTFTPSSVVAGVHTINFKFLRLTTAAGTVRISNVLISPSADTTYFDGSTGGVWLDPITGILGTAHASPSVSQAVAWVEEGTTNILQNPSCENATVTTGTAVRGAGTTMTKDTTYAYLGTSSWKLVGAGTSVVGLQCQSVSSLGYTGSARVFIGSIYLRGSGGETVNVYTTVRYTDATFVSSTVVQHTLTDVWTRITTNTLTLNSAKTADYIMVYVETASATSSATYFVDAAQVEEKAYATSYCDGSLGTGYAWSGTAHASSSTRTATIVTVDETARIRAASGAAAARFYAVSGRTGDRELIRVGAGTAGKDVFRFVANTSGPLYHVWQSNGGAATTLTKAASVAADAWRFAWATWNGTAIATAAGSDTAGTTTRSAVQGDLSSTLDLRIGQYDTTPQNPLNGYIGPVLIADRPLTAKERATLNARTQWAWATLKGRRRIVPGP